MQSFPNSRIRFADADNSAVKSLCKVSLGNCQKQQCYTTAVHDVNSASCGLVQVDSEIPPTAEPVVPGFLAALDSIDYIPS